MFIDSCFQDNCHILVINQLFYLRYFFLVILGARVSIDIWTDYFDIFWSSYQLWSDFDLIMMIIRQINIIDIMSVNHISRRFPVDNFTDKLSSFEFECLVAVMPYFDLAIVLLWGAIRIFIIIILLAQF